MRRVAAIAALLALGAAACGGGDGNTAGSEARTVQIEMRDIAYAPESISVQKGETVRFVFTNKGKVTHDAFVGDEAAQAEHEKTMRASDGGHGGGHGDDPEGAITVEPSKTGELTHTFAEAGEIQVGCHQPGHYDAGMKLDVTVA